MMPASFILRSSAVVLPSALQISVTTVPVVMLILLLLPSQAGAWVYLTTEKTGEIVHWEDGGPCTIAFQYHPAGLDSIPGMKEFSFFKEAMTLWNTNPCTDLRIAMDGVDPECEIHKPAFPGEEQNCIVVTDEGWEFGHPKDIGAAMLTILSYEKKTGLLADVDIDINEDLFDFAWDETGEGDPDDLVNYRFAVVHELGHVYGLGHSSEPASIMHSDGEIYMSDDNPLEPQPDDFAGVCAMYSREVFQCNDAPLAMEPGPEMQASTDLVAEPTQEPDPVDPGGGRGACAATSSPDAGAAKLLLVLILMLSLPRKRSGSVLDPPDQKPSVHVSSL